MKELAIAVLVVSAALSGPVAGVSADNAPPLADAGLDQTVSLGSTVLLDATGSRDPDGTVTAYGWRITAPNGSTVSPACPTCGRTEFRPTAEGTYAVRVTVTDDDGATSNDTLYVNVTSGDPPRVTLTGTTDVEADSTATYTADVRRGGAPLDRVVWRVDGTTAEETAVRSGHDSVSLSRNFNSSGDHTVEAVAVGTDEQRRTDSVRVTVERPLPPVADPSPPSDGTAPPDDDDQPTLDPALRGEQTVTGTEPFRERYVVDTARPSDEVVGVRWYRDGSPAGTGPRRVVDWDPGSHELVAVVNYTDGRERTVTFDDGTNDVFVDPRPVAEFDRLDNGSTISGAVSATDAVGNLRRLRVAVDGRTVEEWTAGDRMKSRPIDERELGFLVGDVSAGTDSNVTVTAIDARGQRSEVTRSVVPKAEPEIVRAEFVNGPVDSYHERIDAERYAAHHVTEVDLDGLGPDAVSVETGSLSDDTRPVDSGDLTRHKEYDHHTGTLTVHTYWAGDVPDSYKVTTRLHAEKGDKVDSVGSGKSALFRVTPSPPEIRIDIIHGGDFRDIRNDGMVVDARDSFDPDGTRLEYFWRQGASETEKVGIGKFDSFRFANLTVVDGYQLERKISHSFQDYYTPDIRDSREISGGAYNLTDSIRFKVYTDRFDFTKNTFHEHHHIGVTTSSRAHVVDLKKHYIEERKERISPNINQSGEQYVATVEVDAAAFADDQPAPTVTFFNRANPETTRKSTSLTTDSKIFAPPQTRWTNVTVENRSYVVEIPERTQRRVMTAQRRDELLDAGYQLNRTDRQGTEYVVEKRVQVQKAEYEEETKAFRHKLGRDRFIDRNDDWKAGGRYVRQETRTETETEWRSDRGGSGEFTGETRRVQTAPPEYRTERKYVYYETEERTRTVTETRTRPVPNMNGDGMKTVTYTVEKEETYTVRTKHSYWSSIPRSHSHSRVASRQVRVSPAQYERQYKYRIRTEETVDVEVYEASRRVQRQPAKYEWRTYDTLTNRGIAEEMGNSEDYRLAGERQSKRWILSKQVDTREVTVEEYENPDRVIETRGTVTGESVQVIEQINGNETRREHIGELSRDYSGSGLVSTEAMIEDLQSRTEDSCARGGYYSRCEG
ncbi:PKD domain-containing protein [Halostella litorea]|uniref:PKD domain-containing protein n=1 Tax=Halostella litorea TaxID=2528831 RepID=UPI001091C094|nr:PKD domain-containing protein [Halostella litorea]